jgi:hypothetical protein
MPNFYFILFLKRLDADEKLQYFQLPYIPCRMVSGNEIKLCLKYFCLPIYFIHFEISLTFISPKPSPKPSDVQLLSTRHTCSPLLFLSLRVLTIYLIFYAITLSFIMFICPFVGPLIWTNKILYLV